MHRTGLNPIGMVACWIGGNISLNKCNKTCNSSYSFCIKDGHENKRDRATIQAKEEIEEL